MFPHPTPSTTPLQARVLAVLAIEPDLDPTSDSGSAYTIQPLNLPPCDLPRPRAIRTIAVHLN